MRPALIDDDKNHPRFKDPAGRLLQYGWFYNRPRNFTLGVPAKCGTASIKQFIWMHELEETFISIQDKNVGGYIYFVVRHPLDRFCSVWKSKCRDARLSQHREIISGISPTELMDYIKTGVRDVHWAPQMDLLGSYEAKLIPLEMLGFWWKQSGLGNLDKFNTTEGDVEIDDELKERILLHWAEDIELYHKAQCDFCWDIVIQ